MPTRQRKRQRNESTRSTDNKDSGKQRPSPPPPAPPSLIRLLKKDKKVLEYFRALQVNLNYDVEKWRKRSNAYKEELEELKRKEQKRREETDQLANLPPEKSSFRIDPEATKKETQIDDSAFDFELSSSSEDEIDGDDKEDTRTQKPLLSTVSKQQAAGRSYRFNVDEDDDDDEDDNSEDLGSKNRENYHDEQHRRNWKYRTDMSENIPVNESSKKFSGNREHHSKDKLVPKRIQIAWKSLRKADEYLKEIGIFLATTIVITENIDTNDESDGNAGNTGSEGISGDANGRRDEENPTDTPACNMDKSDTEQKESRVYTSYVRRDDNDVLGDIIQIIKEWTKLKITATFPMKHSEHSNERDTMLGGHGTFNHHYAAFTTKGIIPCFVPLPDHLLRDAERQKVEGGKINHEFESPMVPQHPAVRGVGILIKALAFIDAFGSVLDEVEIDSELDCEINGTYGTSNKGVGSYYTQLVKNEISREVGSRLSSSSEAILFVTGMKKRHSMVRSFVKSLEGEICDAWPVQDRFSLLGNQALHDNRNQSKEGNVNVGPIEPSNETPLLERKLILDSKNSLRLATMVDRCILARIVTAIHLYRSDPSSAIDFLFRYILSTAPSLQQDMYPKYQPIQSLLLIETILETSFPMSMNDSEAAQSTLLDFFLADVIIPELQRSDTKRNGIETAKIDSYPLSESFQVTLAISAAIYRFRITHDDTRISEPGLAEEAAFHRIASRLVRSGIQIFNIEATNGESGSLDSTLLSYRDYCHLLVQNFLEPKARLVEGKNLSTFLKWMLPITMIMQGDCQKLQEVFSEKTETFLSSKSRMDLVLIEGFSKAIREMEIRNIDTYRAVVSCPTTTDVETVSRSLITSFVDSVIGGPETDNNTMRLDVSCLSIMIGICHELADGENALRLIQWWLKCKSTQEKTSIETSQLVEYWLTFPMVRIINLERRKDRMASFVSQAMHAGLWTIRGVIPPERWDMLQQQKTCQKSVFAGAEANILTSHVGTFAIDGSQGSPAQVELKLMEWLELGGVPSSLVKRELDSLIKPQWRPNDLRAFDIHASDDPNLVVSLSPSEKACALSHIATWKGIASSLFANGFTYTGFARGDPMHDHVGKINEGHTPPCPVALVLEDDATLVDRFQDRLEQLLEELPRDFHFCALGYAKPKEAPLLDIPGCKHIKLPTMTWYLTGYLLSEAGAQYLLKSLPVVGPIDAWMGLKMILTSNWENEFGHRMGVGDAPQTGYDYVRPSLSRKEIRLCMKFRAYCAGVPLCDQKVRTATATGASASQQSKPSQNWRLRDSDIVYSGNVVTKNKKRKSYRTWF